MPSYSITTGSPTSLTGAHTCSTTAGNLGLFVDVTVVPLSSSHSYTGFTRSCAYNGAAMTSLGAVDCSASKDGWIERFYLGPTAASPSTQPSAGTHNIVFTINTGVSSILMNSVSYSGVSQITPGSFVTAAGTAGTSRSITVPSAPGKFVLGGFACSGAIQGQQVVSLGAASAGSFTLITGGVATAQIAYNAPANTGAGNVQAALQAIVGSGNATVTGSAGGPWTVTWAGTLANTAQPLLLLNSSLTGATPSVTGANGTTQLVLQNVAATDGGNLLLADAAGAASVTLEATTASSSNWGALACSIDAVASANATTQLAIDSVVSGISGSSSGNSTAVLKAAVTGQQATVATSSSQIGGLAGLSVSSLNAALQKSQVGLGGTSSGLFETVNFSGYANQSNLANIPTAGTAFTQSGSGLAAGLGTTLVTGIGISSGQAAWLGSTSQYDFEYYPAATTTDYQIVSMTMGSLKDLTSATNIPLLYLFGRSNTAGSTFVYARLSGGQGGGACNVDLGCYVSGTQTNFLSTSHHSPIAGALYELVIGSSATSNLYSLSLLCNGSTVVSYTDSGHVSQVGSSYRYAGFAMDSFSGVPPSLSAWGIADNAPPAVIGSVFRAYCTRTSSFGTSITPSPSTYTLVAGGSAWNLLQPPASFFDTVEWNTSDLTWTPSTNKITIGITGTYRVNVSLMIVASATPTQPMAAIWHNGTLFDAGGYVKLASGDSAKLQASFEIYCAAGDTLTPGLIYAAGGFSYGGDTGGVGNSFSVGLTNCGTLS